MVINCTVTSTTTLFMLNNFLRSHRPRPKDPHNKAKYDNLQNIFCFFRKFLKKALDKCPKTVYNVYCYLGVAQIGSALPWGGRGRRFKSCHSDQLNRLIIKIERFSFIFINFINKHSLLQYAMREAQSVEKVCFYKTQQILYPYPQTPFPGKGLFCWGYRP